MKAAHKRIAGFLALLVTALCLSACGANVELDADGNIIVPPSVARLRDKTLTFATDAATNFNGKWANWHKDMIASGEARNFERYEIQSELLKTLKKQSGARNVYIIYAEDGGTDAESYKISMDAADKPAEFGASIEARFAIREAWEGRACADVSAWNYKKDDPCWSAFAPIYDGEINIVAVLGLDYPAPGILSYPEWNRDSRKWNGVSE
jgi:hypothetical protein